ncbi:MAG: endo alpha-1,4 polygalactosaminidase [Candidatus Aenigmarchaeota archaeon]|nr:endo alpha-1,4 polygalactosaminidase [Candidatus Aenigmarchaeota archaeon]
MQFFQELNSYEFYLTHDVKYDDRLPSWSQDGKKILWQRTEIGKDDWKIYTADIAIPTSSSPSTIDPRLENVKQLTNGPDDTDNSWTWDENILSSRTGNGVIPNIFLLVDGKWHRVTNSGKEDGAPSQSPNIKWIAFESHILGKESQSDIWIIKNSLINDSSNSTNTIQINNLPDLSDRNIQIPKIELGSSFQLQFAGEFDKSIDVDVYDLDLYDTNKALVDELHTKGKKVICYINVGAWEDWRSDKDDFPKEVIGNDYDGWLGEKWLDIRQVDKLAPIIEKRFDLCKDKGFDGIEPDNINGFENPTGFQLTYEDQLRYNKWLSEQAHERGLSIGLKNTEQQAKDLIDYYDYALLEGCFVGNWCEELRIFTENGKQVFMIEYTDTEVDFRKACEKANKLGFTALLKNRNLDSFIQKC